MLKAVESMKSMTVSDLKELIIIVLVALLQAKLDTTFFSGPSGIWQLPCNLVVWAQRANVSISNPGSPQLCKLNCSPSSLLFPNSVLMELFGFLDCFIIVGHSRPRKISNNHLQLLQRSPWHHSCVWCDRSGKLQEKLCYTDKVVSYYLINIRLFYL